MLTRRNRPGGMQRAQRLLETPESIRVDTDDHAPRVAAAARRGGRARVPSQLSDLRRSSFEVALLSWLDRIGSLGWALVRSMVPFGLIAIAIRLWIDPSLIPEHLGIAGAAAVAATETARLVLRTNRPDHVVESDPVQRSATDTKI